MQSSNFVVSASRVRVWRRPEDHPLLKQTDTAHPAFRGKLAERFPPRIAEGLPKVLSENSEDARTWYYFSPLLSDEPQRTRVLTQLLRQSFFGALPPQVFKDIPTATLQFWPKLPPPPSRQKVEGESEPDLLIKLGQSAVIFVEAKCNRVSTAVVCRCQRVHHLRPRSRSGYSPDRRRFLVRSREGV